LIARLNEGIRLPLLRLEFHRDRRLHSHARLLSLSGGGMCCGLDLRIKSGEYDPLISAYIPMAYTIDGEPWAVVSLTFAFPRAFRPISPGIR